MKRLVRLALACFAAAPAFAAPDAVTLKVGRVNSYPFFGGKTFTSKAPVAVTNGTTEILTVKVECGFFDREDLIATDDALIDDIAPGQTGRDTVVTLSAPRANRAECRIVGRAEPSGLRRVHRRTPESFCSPAQETTYALSFQQENPSRRSSQLQ